MEPLTEKDSNNGFAAGTVMAIQLGGWFRDVKADKTGTKQRVL